MIPGQVFPMDGELEFNADRATITIVVENVGDRPIQVGSHYHFAATNPGLSFDRVAARGFRLDIPAGTSTRFEPGISAEVHLVALAGARRVPGLRLESGPESVDAPASNAPASNAPASNAPASNASTSNAPGTDAPGTDAPGTDAPGTDA